MFLVSAFPWAPTGEAARQGAGFRHLPLLLHYKAVVFSSRQWVFGDSKVKITVRDKTAPRPTELLPKASAPLLPGASSLQWSQGQV